jgi:hypothetical protein
MLDDGEIENRVRLIRPMEQHSVPLKMMAERHWGEADRPALTEGRTVLELAEGLQLRRVRLMGAHRIELSGFTDTMRDRLRTYGLFAEIIAWKLRMFMPTDADGAEVLAKVLDRYPIERIAERDAA